MKSTDRLVRRVIPSAAKLSYNPVFRVLGNVLSAIPSVIYPEFRKLPPNHLRVRVGVGNRVISNQTYHLEAGIYYWLQWLSSGYVSATSDIVEIGCGCGRIAHHLRRDWFKGTYVGIDIDSELLQWCSSHFPQDKFTFVLSPHTSATYAPGDVGNGGSFAFPEDWQKDFVYSTSLYTHLLTPELLNYTSQSFKVLRPGGVMYMTFFCLDSVERGNRWTFQHRIGEAYVESMKYPEAAVGYSREYMESLCRSVGFRDVSVIESHGQSMLICRK